MEWTQVITILGGNLGMFLWATRQSRADYLYLDKKMDDNRREITSLIREIHNEMKDFHNRLCDIEKEKIKK